MAPLAGLLVVDLTRYLPGAYAGRELQRLGARVVRIELPDGEPLRATAPAWDAALNAGKESVVCDLKSEDGLSWRARSSRARTSCSRASDPASRRGSASVPTTRGADAVYCSITGFGVGGRHEQRAGHDVNYLGWAGALADTAPGLPPLQIADLAAGGLGAVTQILAALIERRGARITVSMTHRSHDLVAHRVGRKPCRSC